MTTSSAIHTHGLTKRYGELRAVDTVDIDVREGDVYGFLGANGSGKTTTVRMLLGLVLPTNGQAEVLGQPMPASRRTVLPQVGALVEEPGAYPHLSGGANLALLDATGPNRLRGGGRRSQISSVLERVGLDPVDRRPTRAYSLGMRQRLGLAAALMRRPRLLILDEPTNGLDPQGITEIRRLLLELNASGTTIFLSSHLLSEIEQMCTRVGVLDRGRLVLEEELDALLRPTGLVEVQTADAFRCASLLGDAVVGVEGQRLLVSADDPAALNAYLVGEGIRVSEVGPYRRDLEQVVLDAVASERRESRALGLDDQASRGYPLADGTATGKRGRKAEVERDARAGQKGAHQ
jgi:ABC-type multidrug transport system ATPase subunit